MALRSLIILVIIACCGCASFGRGFAEGLRRPTSPGECRIYSAGFEGLESGFINHTGPLKVLNIHGIGEHMPGYSVMFANEFADRMDLYNYAPGYKEITLSSSVMPDTNIGTLRVYKRYSDDGREMLYYEYSWSVVSQPLKHAISFDSTDVGSLHRANINATLKTFFNDIVPDAVVYAGKSEYQAKIFLGLSQSICWMMTNDWNSLPDSGEYTCRISDLDKGVMKSKYVIIGNSMGSQIALDAVHWLAYSYMDNYNDTSASRPDVQLFLLSNQIPLLSIGKDKPVVYDREKDFCSPGAPLYDERYFDKLSIVAFSDPNDILTYILPEDFINNYVDSRLCPDPTNIVLNVAPVVDMVGLAEFVNPMLAHQNYPKNDTVLNLIVHGTKTEQIGEDPTKGCRWYVVK